MEKRAVKPTRLLGGLLVVAGGYLAFNIALAPEASANEDPGLLGISVNEQGLSVNALGLVDANVSDQGVNAQVASVEVAALNDGSLVDVSTPVAVANVSPTSINVTADRLNTSVAVNLDQGAYVDVSTPVASAEVGLNAEGLNVNASTPVVDANVSVGTPGVEAEAQPPAPAEAQPAPTPAPAVEPQPLESVTPGSVEEAVAVESPAVEANTAFSSFEFIPSDNINEVKSPTSTPVFNENLTGTTSVSSVSSTETPRPYAQLAWDENQVGSTSSSSSSSNLLNFGGFYAVNDDTFNLALNFSSLTFTEAEYGTVTDPNLPPTTPD